MSKNVFANGNEVSCKKDDNKSIAAMADVCLSPPSPPAGPVPIPYPNTAEASDTTDGSKTVKIGGSEVGMKNSSSYKKSTGDEAATKSLGMGVVSHNIQGKMKHSAWSMDVKIEGANAIRHMDMTTHNHANPDDVALTLNAAGQLPVLEKELSCEELKKARDDAQKKDLAPQTPPKPPLPKDGQTHAVGQFTSQSGKSVMMKGVSHMKDMVKSGARSGYAKGKFWPFDMVEKLKWVRSKTTMLMGSLLKPDKQTYWTKKQKLVKMPVPKKDAKVGKACQEEKNYDVQGVQHAEATMIEDIIGAARKSGIGMPRAPGGPSFGKINFSIDCRSNKPGQAKDGPCPSCNDLMCEAIKCGLDITFCKDGDTDKPTGAPNCK